MAARLAQIEAELKDLAAQVGDGTDEDLAAISDPVDRLLIYNKIDELGKSEKLSFNCLRTRPDQL